jgi:hypothetical protein
MMHLDKSVMMYMYIDILLLTIILCYSMQNMFCLDLFICSPFGYLFLHFYYQTQVSLVTATQQYV